MVTFIVIHVNPKKVDVRNRAPRTQHDNRSVHVHYIRKPPSVSLQAFDRCAHKCHMTDGNYVDHEAAALIIHGPWITAKWNPPKKPRGQIWVFQAMEPPEGVLGSLQKWRGLFNWTMTHRRDSDIFSPYGSFMKVPRNSTQQLSPLKWESKDRMVAWFVSHCKTASKREAYVKQLERFVDVHVYGGCGQHICDRSQEQTCLAELENHYKFYLAFENSWCNDYITEKPFKMYWNNLYTIPITRGIGDIYNLFLPPGSFLNTKDFTSIQELGEEINAILMNKERFKAYFNWRKYYVTEEIDLFYCDLCRMLHNPDKYSRVYDNIEEWVIDHPNRRACKQPDDI